MNNGDHYSWSIAAIGDEADHYSGCAAALTDAWAAALSAGRAALLAGEIETVEVRIEGELEALYSPGRDDAGLVDQAVVTADFVEMLRDVTATAVAGELLHRLVNPGFHAVERGGHGRDLAVPSA